MTEGKSYLSEFGSVGPHTSLGLLWTCCSKLCPCFVQSWPQVLSKLSRAPSPFPMPWTSSSVVHGLQHARLSPCTSSYVSVSALDGLIHCILGGRLSWCDHFFFKINFYWSMCMCMPSHFSLVQLCNPMDYSLPGSSVRGDSPGKNTGVGCHALFQGIFPTQG